MPRIKFTRDYKVKAADGETFRKDQTVEVSEASARHFVNRGAAEMVASRRSAAESEGDKGDASPSTATPADDLHTKTVVELHEIAKTEAVEGTSGLHKDDLVKAIQKHRKAKK